MTERKYWVFPEQKPKESTVQEMVSQLKLLPSVARLLSLRGVKSVAEAKRFLSLEDTVLYDPFLLTDMDLAVERIEQALMNQEKITVYGDYDVDGVTSTATLYLYLKARGAQVDYYIPRRLEEGYGMNRGAIEQLVQNGTKLFLTVDTGITANAEVEWMRTLGAEAVITDHHACQLPLPNACAVVNPHREDSEYPFAELAGVGVVFKLLCALETSYALSQGKDPQKAVERICYDYGDLVALGTVADVMPLVEENRLIVRYGLHRMETDPRMGIRALISAAGADSKGRYQKRRITASTLGFTVAPRINAAGRMEDARVGVELFLQDSEFATQEIAHSLCELNRVRQQEENRIAKEAEEMIESSHDLTQESVLVLAKEGWHQGVIGIVASRLTERYHLPCILISLEGEMGKGSGRSVHGLHLVEALTACSAHLERFGGHELAAGLSLKKDQVEAFATAINEYAQPLLAGQSRAASLAVDLELDANEISLPLVQQLDWLEPFGTQNPQPVFALRDAELMEVIPIGNAKHTKMILQAGGQLFTALYFGVCPESLAHKAGDLVDVAFTLDLNEYQGNRMVQLLLKDVTYGKQERNTIAKSIIEYANLTSQSGKLPKGAVPTYESFGSCYRALRKLCTKGATVLSLQELYLTFGKTLSRAQIRVIIEVFAQLHFLRLTVVDNDPLSYTYRIEMPAQTAKAALEDSPLYRRMRQREEI